MSASLMENAKLKVLYNANVQIDGRNFLKRYTLALLKVLLKMVLQP